MIRFIVYLAIAIAIVWFATTVQLGKHTLVGHIRAIWHTEEVRDLKDGVREKTAPAVDKLERSVKDGYHAATKNHDGDGSATTTTVEAKP